MEEPYIFDEQFICKNAYHYMFRNGLLIKRECSIYVDQSDKEKDRAKYIIKRVKPICHTGDISLYPGVVEHNSLWLETDDEYLAKQLLIQDKRKRLLSLNIELKDKQAQVREIKNLIGFIEEDISSLK